MSRSRSQGGSRRVSFRRRAWRVPFIMDLMKGSPMLGRIHGVDRGAGARSGTVVVGNLRNRSVFECRFVQLAHRAHAAANQVAANYRISIRPTEFLTG